MGDARRFDIFADIIAEKFPDYRKARIADVAAGKGYLQAALRQRGFREIVSWDRRKSFAGPRSIYRYGLFDHRTSENFDLVVGMHPDEATDHIVTYGRKRKIPWIVCPCCVRPSAAEFGSGANDYWRWLAHLRTIGGGPARVKTLTIPIRGRNVVLVGECA